jgi:hypothetical protein
MHELGAFDYLLLPFPAANDNINRTLVLRAKPHHSFERVVEIA